MSQDLRTALWLVLFLAFWITSATIGIMSHLAIQAMVAEVNPHLDDNRRFSEAWWYAGKYQRLFSEYHRLYPSGGRIRQVRRLWRLLVLLLVSVALVMGFGLAVALFLGVGGSLIDRLTFKGYTA